MSQHDEPKYAIPARDRPCDYCGDPSVGTVNGHAYCRPHFHAAMDNVKPMADVTLKERAA